MQQWWINRRKIPQTCWKILIYRQSITYVHSDLPTAFNSEEAILFQLWFDIITELTIFFKVKFLLGTRLSCQRKPTKTNLSIFELQKYNNYSNSWDSVISSSIIIKFMFTYFTVLIWNGQPDVSQLLFVVTASLLDRSEDQLLLKTLHLRYSFYG